MPDKQLFTFRNPVGVAAIITAGNFPVAVPSWYLVPAILCGNDEIALQAYLAALSLGLRIPEDVSIAGFDDFRIVSLALKPELTTAALPYYDLGFQGATLLERVLGQEATEVTPALLACDLVLSGSVTAPT